MLGERLTLAVLEKFPNGVRLVRHVGRFHAGRVHWHSGDSQPQGGALSQNKSLDVAWRNVAFDGKAVDDAGVT